LLKDGLIEQIDVIRGAPCAATWEAARRVTGLAAGEAVIRFGLETQLFCKADPSNWDPVHGKSPVHLAARLHSQALKSAIKNS